MSLDKEAAHELELFIENDSQLYNQQNLPILKNLAAKMASGKYDKEKAVKLWMYLMESGAKKYARDFGNAAEWNKIFTVATRKHAAERFNEAFLVEYGLGNYASLLPKKYQPKR